MATRVPAQDGKGDLARLLATEQRLEQLVARARAEAEHIVTEARAQADAREAALATELESGMRKMTDAIASERARRETEVADKLNSEAARFKAVRDERIRELAVYVLQRVIGSGENP